MLCTILLLSCLISCSFIEYCFSQIKSLHVTILRVTNILRKCLFLRGQFCIDYPIILFLFEQQASLVNSRFCIILFYFFSFQFTILLGY